jgi:hypothetical protein
VEAVIFIEVLKYFRLVFPFDGLLSEITGVEGVFFPHYSSDHSWSDYSCRIALELYFY